MRRGRHKGVFTAAVAALKFDLSWFEEGAARTRQLIEQLTERAGVEARNSSAEKSSVPPKQKPRKAKRRRRKPVAARKRAPAVPVPVVVPASGNQGKGALLFADQLEELKRLFATIDTDEADAARAYGIIVELKGRSRLPKEYTKAVRMRLKRRAAAAAKPVKRAAVSAPKRKKKAPRKPAVPIPAPIVRRTDWHPDPDGSGNLVREIITS